MNFLKALARSFLGAVAVFVGLYFAISLAVLTFKVTGRLGEGQPMFFEMDTPSYAGLFTFQAICLAVIAACLYGRRKLAPKA